MRRTEFIPTRRNGCICFIPIAQPVPPQNDRIISNCIEYCMRVSRELGGEPTEKECRMCCTDCVNTVDDPEICNESCVLGKGGPGERLMNIVRRALDIRENFASALLPLGVINTRSRFGEGKMEQFVNSDIINTIYQRYGEELRDGQTLAMVASHFREDLFPSLPSRGLVTVNGNIVGFDSTTKQQNGNTVARSQVFLTISYLGDNRVRIYYTRCVRGIDIYSRINVGLGFGNALYLLVALGEQPKLLEASTAQSFSIDFALVGIDRIGTYCNDITNPPVVFIDRQL